MKKSNQLIVGLLVVTAWCGPAAATTRCANSGEVDQPIDASLAPKIAVWVQQAEVSTGIDHLVYRFPSKKPATTSAEARLDNLVAVVAEWEREPVPGSVESFFRQAVGHGVNVEYETLMVTQDPKNAALHRMWRDTEAARANACLSLTHPQ